MSLITSGGVPFSGGALVTTFTAKLAQLVASGGLAALGDVRVDGPYGSAGEPMQQM